ncbi:MAG TPA: pyruvate kinase [Pirellulaceae bacterium]
MTNPSERHAAIDPPSSGHDRLFGSRARSKIVATVGPACRAPSQLESLARAGVDVFRLNTAHGTPEAFATTIRDIRALEARVGPLAILLDLAGPKIRLGSLDPDPYSCTRGATVRFVRGTNGGPGELTTNYERLIEELRVGDRIVLADGVVSLCVESKSSDYAECRVLDEGIVRGRQGVNLPGAQLMLPSLTDQDLEWVAWSVTADVDFLSLSFVRSAQDIRDLKTRLRALEHKAAVIAKIEKPEALHDLEAIVEASDGLMVARGDLGVEIDVAEVPVAQKRIVELCNAWQRPVIVATQMLESMHHAPRPTRAEATDVANAILDGADACMLSGETAVGEYPLAAVETMQRIMRATEVLFQDRTHGHRPHTSSHRIAHPSTHAVVYAAGRIAEELSAKLVVVATRTGTTAVTKSNLRDFIPTIAVSDDPRVLRRMSLLWGIIPIPGAPTRQRQELKEFVIAWGKQTGLLASRDLFVLIGGTLLFPDAHNQLVIYEVP